MDTMSAYMNLKAAKKTGAKLMVFDWDKAARLIKARIPKEASAGLCGDWENTGGMIWKNGKPRIESSMYLASLWAVPELNMDGDVVECWRLKEQSPGWDSGTVWPRSAMKIVSVDKGGSK